MSASLTLTNPSRNIGRVKESKDFSIFNHDRLLEQTKRDIESSLVVTTLHKTKAHEIEKLLEDKEPLIIQRNKILANPIRYFFNKKKLNQMDSELDKIDLQIYLLETENSLKKDEIHSIVLNAEKRLEKYAK